MADPRQKRVLAVLEEALELEAHERPDWLGRTCRGDASLRDEVERLLAVCDRPGSEDFMEVPAFSFDPNVGRQVGAYELVRRLDRGGMSVVYLARRRDPEKKVVVKLIQEGMDRPEIQQRFLKEREILAQLIHPNIATLHDGGTTEEGQPYFVMEYIEGEPIDRYCERENLTSEARIRLVQKVCRAVHFAHCNLVVHRDLKPDNILVTSGGEPKLLDFGIAKLLGDSFARAGITEAGRAPMTRLYASPRADPRPGRADDQRHLFSGRRALQSPDGRLSISLRGRRRPRESHTRTDSATAGIGQGRRQHRPQGAAQGSGRALQFG